MSGKKESRKPSGISTGTYAVLKKIEGIIARLQEDGSVYASRPCASVLDGDCEFRDLLLELWDYQTDSEYAVSRREYPDVESLWLNVRMRLGSLTCADEDNRFDELDAFLNDNSSALIVPPFVTPDDPPHCPDGMILYMLYKAFSIWIDRGDAEART